MGTTWNTKDLTVDDQGRPTIKNPDLAKAIGQRLTTDQGPLVKFDQSAVALVRDTAPRSDQTGLWPWPNPQDNLCMCRITKHPELH